MVITATIGPVGERITEYFRQPAVVNRFFDRFGNGKLKTITRWQQVSVASMQGDARLIASPLDYIRFMQSLVEGRQVPLALLHWMTTWVEGSYAKPIYGMGLYFVTHQEQPGYGHSGAGIGAAGTLYYFSEKQVYVSIGVNVGMLTGGPTAHLAEPMQEKLLDELLT